jgi:hypothetical protein
VTDGRPTPGETSRRLLDRPPGDRYRRPTTGADLPLPERPNLQRALALGLAAAVGVGFLFAVIVGILDVGLGLLALSALGGFGIGAAVHRGAWTGRREVPGRGVPAVAALLALFAWLGGHFGAYLFSLLLRPDSSLSFAERMAQSSFGDWLAPQLGVAQAIEIVLLVSLAAYAARARSSGL